MVTQEMHVFHLGADPMLKPRSSDKVLGGDQNLGFAEIELRAFAGQKNTVAGRHSKAVLGQSLTKGFSTHRDRLQFLRQRSCPGRNFLALDPANGLRAVPIPVSGIQPFRSRQSTLCSPAMTPMCKRPFQHVAEARKGRIFFWDGTL